MSADDRPRREVAHRVFAAEYNDATYTYRESEEERAPNYLVTPSGARVNRVFVVGVLTEVEAVGDDVVRARVVDPTGAFVVYAGQYQPDALAFFEDADPPAFVAVTGKANTFQPEGSDRTFTSVRPESVTTVEADTRDRWVVGTAERTIDRIARFSAALDQDRSGETLRTVLREAGYDPSLAAGIPKAMEAYDTSPTYLGELRRVAIDALRWVTGEIDEVDGLAADPAAGGSTSAPLTSAPSSPAPIETSDTDAAAPTETDRTVEEPTPEAGSVGEQVGTDAAAGAPAEAEPAGEPGETVEREAGTGGTGAGAEDDQPPEEVTGESESGEEEFYELDEDERQAVEDEYGVEFNSGEDIPDAGEADIDAPDTDEESDPSEEPASEATTDSGDLEDVVVEQMRDLADDGGANRETLIERTVEARGVDRDAVEDAIQDALMSGRCYESGEDELTPI